MVSRQEDLCYGVSKLGKSQRDKMSHDFEENSQMKNSNENKPLLC